MPVLARVGTLARMGRKSVASGAGAHAPSSAAAQTLVAMVSNVSHLRVIEEKVHLIKQHPVFKDIETAPPLRIKSPGAAVACPSSAVACPRARRATKKTFKMSRGNPIVDDGVDIEGSASAAVCTTCTTQP